MYVYLSLFSLYVSIHTCISNNICISLLILIQSKRESLCFSFESPSPC